ncbi:Chitinase A1 [Termitomyces sp. T112]|nr:Chitinase A1 [Termitomyces sp. T112]
MFPLRTLCLVLSRLIFIAGYDLQGQLEPRATISASSLSSSLVSAAWYAGWHATDQPVSAVSWSKYNIIHYAFGLTTVNPAIVSLQASDRVLLPQFVKAAHDHNVKASLSIGGWTGSRWFSSNVGSAQNRSAFVEAVTGLVKEYKLDGIDFDWEYPGTQGIGCNTLDSNDTANFLSFFQELRLSLGPDKVISAAVGLKPFPDSSGAPFAEVSRFGEVLDYVVIMNYDVPSTPTSGVGPNSPLSDKCAPADSQYGSASSALAAWTAAGMPKDHIVLGVPMYGHSYRVHPDVAYADQSKTSLASYPPYEVSDKPTGDRWNGNGGLDVCGVYEPLAGTYVFWSLVDSGFLNVNGSAKPGIAYRYDACSQTPYVYNSTSEVMIAYDDPQSFYAKGDFIKSKELRGFAVWESAGDYNDLLVNAILNGTINGNSRTNDNSPTESSTTKKSSSASQSRPYPSLLKFWYLILGLACICGWIHI